MAAEGVAHRLATREEYAVLGSLAVMMVVSAAFILTIFPVIYDAFWECV